MNGSPIGRDFKRAGRHGRTDFSFSREFFVGLAIGLVIAALVYVWQRQVVRDAVQAAESAPPRPRPALRDPASTDDSEATPKYGFYDMLPQAEVVLPETDPKAPVPALPNTPIERPGVYVLQPGAFRTLEEAERLQAKLLRLGVRAAVQRVAIDNDEFHRVRIGPIEDLASLNRTRATLQRADIEAVVIRVGD